MYPNSQHAHKILASLCHKNRNKNTQIFRACVVVFSAALQCLLAEAYLGFIESGVEAFVFMDKPICCVYCGDPSQLSVFESGVW